MLLLGRAGVQSVSVRRADVLTLSIKPTPFTNHPDLSAIGSQERDSRSHLSFVDNSSEIARLEWDCVHNGAVYHYSVNLAIYLPINQNARPLFFLHS